MSDSDFFVSLNPAEPWSFAPLGLPALGLVAALLVALTLWTYRGHPAANSKRISIVLLLRLLALLVVLLTAIRPSVGVQDDPKLPSVLLLGVDMSESMTVPDELGRPRIDAVRRVLEKCQPTLDTLRDEQNVNVVMYGFGPADFADASHAYDPSAPARFNRSDYGTYLNRTFDRWQSERFVRGHVIIGDGQDNGTAFRAEAEAARWRQAGRQVHTFAVGRPDTDDDARDVALKSVSTPTANPDGSVFVKTELTLRVVIDAFGFENVKVPVVVWVDEGGGYEQKATESVSLTQKKGNEIDLKLKAPDRPGEIKVKVEVPADRTPGDVAPSNNVIETYIPVTKEGMRVLLVGRADWEHKFIRRAFQADKRIDLFEVFLQPDAEPGPGVREDLDFDRQGYDAVLLGNVSAEQLRTVDPRLPQRLAEQVLKRGTGLLMTGGHATFLGTPGLPAATGWRGTKAIEDVLPVDLSATPPVPDTVFADASARFQFVPTTDHYLTRVADTPAQSAALWARLNGRDDNGKWTRFTGLSKVGAAKPTATVYAVASADPAPLPVPAPPGADRTLAPLLVGHEIGVGGRGRVLVLAAQDTYLWMKLGLPQANDGVQLHARFWHHLVRWLAHQEEDDAAAFARPELKRLPVGGNQTVRVGLRMPGGAPAVDPKFNVKVVAPGESAATAKPRPVLPDPEGGFRLPYQPGTAGEYTVVVAATGKDKDGKEVQGEATARFLAYPEASDEMLRKAADPTFLRKIAAAGGGKFHPLEELPGFLRELAAVPLDVKPKPRYVPDWRRDHSGGFLPAWLIVFVSLLGAEWGLRRMWGMI